MELTYQQKLEIYERGFVHLPGVVPRIMVDAALRAINHSVGEGMNAEEMTRMRAQTFCRELTREPVITDLINRTPAWSLAESAIGPGKIKPIGSGQIALRFPGMQDPPPPARPHLDGMYSPTNGVPEGTIQNFTALLGILLSDLPDTHMGNFTIWPGTHHLYEKYFRQHSPQSLLNGMPAVPLPEPHPIIGRAGDVVLCHYELAHGVTPNVSPHVRYAVFFRLTHVEHDAQKWESMTDIWREWEGMQEIVARYRQVQQPV